MSLDISRVKALCFDVDGTLSDTDDQFVHKLAKWLAIFSFLFPSKDPLILARRMVMATETPGNFLYGIPDRLGLDDEAAALGDLIYRLGLGAGPKPFLLVPGVKDALTELERHYPLSVVSARGARTTSWFLDQCDLNPLFQCVATAQTCEHTKPYPDPILWAAEMMRVTPGECLMIGDTTVDILAAKAAGAQSVGVLCGFGEEKELRRAGANLVLTTTAQLTAVLLNRDPSAA
jgi:phosphoglycolate phosphatase-like HAD superfamily hydrolase